MAYGVLMNISGDGKRLEISSYQSVEALEAEEGSEKLKVRWRASIVLNCFA